MTTDPFMEAARLGARSSTLIEYEEIPHLPRIKRRARRYSAAMGMSSTCAQASALPLQQAARLSSMMRRMVRAQRPHCGLHPRQPYTWFAVAGRAGAASIADRTSSRWY